MIHYIRAGVGGGGLSAGFQCRRRIMGRCSSRKGGARMSDRALVVAAGLVLMLFSVTAGWTQTDPPKLLVGPGNGHLRTETGPNHYTLNAQPITEESTHRA